MNHSEACLHSRCRVKVWHVKLGTELVSWEHTACLLSRIKKRQGVFKVEPRDSHAVCTFQVHPPTSPYPAYLLKQNLSPEVIAGSDVTR